MNFNWTPKIGDPTVGGWLTVALYFVTVFICWRTAVLTAQARGGRPGERRIWWCITLLFIALGINKELDLQSALTELGRMVAVSQGWYANRQLVQTTFILAIGCIGVFALFVLLIWARKAAFPTWVALMGVTLVVGFVLMRAASFHHMDRFIGTRVLGLRWNWIVEMGGIAVVLLASLWRRRQLKMGPPT